MLNFVQCINLLVVDFEFQLLVSDFFSVVENAALDIGVDSSLVNCCCMLFHCNFFQLLVICGEKCALGFCWTCIVCYYGEHFSDVIADN